MLQIIKAVENQQPVQPGCSNCTDWKKVLLVDGDMQLESVAGFFSMRTGYWSMRRGEKKKNLYYGIKKQEDLTDYVVHTPYGNRIWFHLLLNEFHRI